MREFYGKNKGIIHKGAFLCFFVLLVYLFINYVFSYVAPFVFGYLIASLLDPVVSYLNRRFKMNRGLSGLILLLVFIVTVVVIGTLIVSKIVFEARAFVSNVPAYIEEGRQLFANLEKTYTDYINIIPEGVRSTIDESAAMFASYVTSLLGSGVGQGSINLVKGLPRAVLSLVLFIISAFFFIKDKKLVDKNVKGLIPSWIKDNLRKLKNGMFDALAGYIKAQLMLMSVAGTISLTGLLILRFPYALLIGLIIAVLDFLPVLGSGTILWPWALYNVLAGNFRTAIGLIVIYSIIFLVRQMLEPKLVGEQIGIHPLLTLMSVYIGLRVFGVLGFIIGPFVVISAKIILNQEENELNEGECIVRIE